MIRQNKLVYVSLLVAVVLAGYYFFFKKSAFIDEKETDEEQKVIFVHHGQNKNTQEILLGLNDDINVLNSREKNLKIKILEKNVMNQKDDLQLIIDNIQKQRPKVIIALSDDIVAALLPIVKELNVPLIYTSMNKLPDKNDSPFSLYYVNDTVSGYQQLKQIKESFPTIKTICVIQYQGDINFKKYVASLKRAAKKLDLTLVFQEIDDVKYTAQAASEIVHDVDGFFVEPTSLISKEIRTIVQVANSYKKPVFGAGSSMLEQGVLACVDQDNFGVGQAIGKKVVKLLQGKRISRTTTVQSKVYVNSEVLKKLGLEIDSKNLGKIEFWDGKNSA